MATINKRYSSGKGKNRNLITYSDADSLISEQFRAIRTNIKFLTEAQKKRAFLITSPGRGEGKTTTAANLAVSMAQQEEKVILIDANLREPAIHKLFNISNDTGLADVLERRDCPDFDEIIHHSGIGNLDLLTGGETFSNPAELLGNERMKTLLKKMTDTYDIVLIDSPTVLDSTETLLLANECDGVVLVLNRGKTRIEKAEEAHRLLEIAHASIIGAIINEK